MAENTRRNLNAFPAADVVGRDPLSRVGEEITHRCLGVYINAFAALIDRRNGTVMHTVGDVAPSG